MIHIYSVYDDWIGHTYRYRHNIMHWTDVTIDVSPKQQHHTIHQLAVPYPRNKKTTNRRRLSIYLYIIHPSMECILTDCIGMCVCVCIYISSS